MRFGATPADAKSALIPPKAIYGEPPQRREWQPIVELDQVGRITCGGKTIYDPPRDHQNLDGIGKLRETLTAEARRRGLVAPFDAADSDARKPELVDAPLRVRGDKWTEWHWIRVLFSEFTGGEVSRSGRSSSRSARSTANPSGSAAGSDRYAARRPSGADGGFLSNGAWARRADRIPGGRRTVAAAVGRRPRRIPRSKRMNRHVHSIVLLGSLALPGVTVPAQQAPHSAEAAPATGAQIDETALRNALREQVIPFHREVDGEIWGGAWSYKASFGSAVSMYLPPADADRERPVHVRWTTTTVRTAGAALSPTPAAEPTFEGRVCRLPRRAVTEVYELRTDGLAQSFEVACRPGDATSWSRGGSTLRCSRPNARRSTAGSSSMTTGAAPCSSTEPPS